MHGVSRVATRVVCSIRTVDDQYPLREYIDRLHDATVERTDGSRRLERGAKTAKRDWHRNLLFTAGLRTFPNPF